MGFLRASARNRRIIIHAGTAKTGSSAIQYWLNETSELLRELGVFYPKHLVDSNKVSSGNLLNIMSLNAQNNTFVFDLQKLAELLDSFYSSDCHTLLLSSEFFFLCMGDLYRAIPDAEFVLYVRNPVLMAESGYKQQIKRCYLKEKLSVNDKMRFRILRIVSKILFENPGINLKLYPYTFDLLLDGKIVQDFIRRTNLNIMSEVKTQVNQSYTLQALEFKRFCNHFPVNKINKELDLALQKYDAGDACYTLIDNNNVRLREIRQENIAEAEAFVALFEKYECGFLMDLASEIDERSYFHQDLGRSETEDIVRYLAGYSPGLLTELRQIVIRDAQHSKLHDGFCEVLYSW